MDNDQNTNRDLIKVAFKELNNCLIKCPRTKSIIKNAINARLSGDLIRGTFTISQAKATLELFRSTKAFTFKYDDDSKEILVKFVWKWMNRQITNLSNKLKIK